MAPRVQIPISPPLHMAETPEMLSVSGVLSFLRLPFRTGTLPGCFYEPHYPRQERRHALDMWRAPSFMVFSRHYCLCR